MQITRTNKSWGEIPDSSFLFRFFNSIQWTRTLDENDLIEIDDIFMDTIKEIDGLDTYDYVKVRLIREYMEVEPMFAWCLHLNKNIISRKYLYLGDLVNNSKYLLSNLERYKYGREKALYIVKFIVFQINNNYINVEDNTFEYIINKIADLMFIYKYITKLSSYNVREDLELAIYEILDIVVEEIDKLLYDSGADTSVDTYLRSIGYDPHDPNYEAEFIDEYEILRSEIIDYTTNILMYAGYRGSNFPGYDYDITTTRLANISIYRAVIEPIQSNILEIIYKVVLETLCIFYEDQIVNNYSEAIEFQKFVVFLFKDPLIKY